MESYDVIRSRVVKYKRAKFLNEIEDTTISNFFNIGQTNRLNFTYDSLSNDYIDIFKVKYINKHNLIYFESLPYDMNYVINSYLCFYIDLEFNIFYPLEYPFQRQIWTLTSIDYSIRLTIIDLLELYA